MAVRVDVAFREVSVRLEPDGVIAVQSTLTNSSGAAWTSHEGWAAGYHLFDNPTGTLAVDGPRWPLDVADGGSATLDLRIPPPREPGVYSIYVSVVREHVAWMYARGWPFLLIELTVAENGFVSLGRERVTNIGSVRRRVLARSVARALYLPFLSIWRQRSLIRTLVRRDILGRYTGSFGGAFWAILNPLLLMLTYFFVFGVVMQPRIGRDASRTGFALYFLAGMLPWLAFSEAAGRAPFVMLEHRNFVKKLVFPVETLPVNVVAAGMITEFFGLVLFLIALAILRGGLPFTAAWLPLILLPQVLLTGGVSWFLAALGVFARDLGQIIGYLLTVLMFLTPIFYAEDALPGPMAGVLRHNPMFVLVHSYRAVLLNGAPPDWPALFWLTLVSLAVFLAGHAWFYKLRRSFADLI